MTAFNAWLYGSGFSEWVRESSSLWAYPCVLFLHSIGLAILVGLTSAIALRVLGVAKQLPVGPLERLYPLIWAGFWINAVSGSVLYAADAVKNWANPLLFVKLGVVAVALVVTMKMKSVVFSNPNPDADTLPAMAKGLAMASLALWAGAIAAGRMMAYWKETVQ